MKKQQSFCAILALALVVQSGYITASAAQAGDEQPVVKTDVGMLPLSGTINNGIRIVNVKTFRYAFEPDPVVVKQGEKVQLVIMSKDFTHRIVILGKNVNIVVPGGEARSIVFLAGDKGIFDIDSSVFAGPGRSHLHAKFIVK